MSKFHSVTIFAMSLVTAILAVVVPACSGPSYTPTGCEAVCMTSDYGLPADQVGCADSRYFNCGVATCDDGSSIDPKDCPNEGIPRFKCANGAYPRCAAGTK